MSLADYQPIRRPVKAGNATLSVRGLSLDDVAVLMHEHLKDLDKLFDIYESNVREDLRVTATAQFAIALTREAPALVANAIALACDEPEHSAKARTLPIPTQVEAIKVIAGLTFDEAGGAKNFLASLTNLLQAIAPAPQQTGSPT